MGSWLSQFVSQTSYLQLYWILQTGHVTTVLVHRLLTDRYHDKSRPNDKPGWFDFHTRPTLPCLVGGVFSAYLAVTLVGAYCFDRHPGQHFLQLFDLVASPHHHTVDAWSSYLALGLFSFHVFRRLYDTTFVSIYSRHRTVDPLSLTKDLVFFVAAGLSLVAESPALSIQPDCVGFWSSWRWLQLVSVALFGFASRVQRQTLEQFARMRRNKAGHIVTTAYKAPTGGWFDRLGVSSPHYLAEVAVHLSVGLALGPGAVTWWLLTTYVTASHARMALDTHRLYRAQFKDYPTRRNILIPYIF